MTSQATLLTLTRRCVLSLADLALTASPETLVASARATLESLLGMAASDSRRAKVSRIWDLSLRAVRLQIIR